MLDEWMVVTIVDIPAVTLIVSAGAGVGVVIGVVAVDLYVSTGVTIGVSDPDL